LFDLNQKLMDNLIDLIHLDFVLIINIVNVKMDYQLKYARICVDNFRNSEIRSLNLINSVGETEGKISWIKNKNYIFFP
jgi:hypothetical protein